MSTDQGRFCQRVVQGFTIAALALTATLSRATADPLLADQRWRENSHGLSLQPPLASRLLEQKADDAVLRIAGEGRYLIKVYIKARQHEAPRAMEFELQKGANGTMVRPETPHDRAVAGGDAPVDKPAGALTVDELIDMSEKQLAVVRPDARIIDTKKLTASAANGVPVTAPMPTSVVYYQIPDPKRGDWIMGQSFTMVDPETVVMLQLEVDKGGYDHARPIFEAVAGSLQVEDPHKLVLERENLLARAAQWRQTVTPELLRKKLVPESWVRIVEEGHDVGYMQTLQKTDREMDLGGTRVDERLHVDVNQQSLDSIANFFVSDDGTTEIWSIRLTIRPLPTPGTPGANHAIPETNGSSPAPPREWTLAETGLRSGKQITVTRQGLDSTKEFKWEQPTRPPQRGPDGKLLLNQPPPALLPYVSQAEVQMLSTILPHQAPLEVGFYAYLPSAQKITFRTERVVPQADGSCIVYSRLSPEQPEEVTLFGRNGKFVKRTEPDGRVFLATTRSELALRNGIKLPR